MPSALNVDVTKAAARTRGRTTSLRWRVTLSVLLLSGFLQVTLGFTVALYQNSSTEALFNTRIGLRLADMASRIEALERTPTAGDLKRLESDSLRFILFDYVAITLHDDLGRVLASTQPELDAVPADLLAAAGRSPTFFAPREFRRVVADEPAMPARYGLRAITLVNGERAVLVLGAGDQNAREFTQSTARLLLVSILGSLAAATLATWLIVGRALAPLVRIGSLANLLRPEDLVTDSSAPPDLPPERIEELATLRRELEAARARLRDAFAAQDRFISNVSHELKTPIAVLLAEAQTINPANLGTEGAAFARSAADELRRLASIIESFLLLTRIRFGKAFPREQHFSIVEAVTDAVAHCEKLASQHGVRLLPIALPGASLEHEIAGDPTLVEVMVEGLIRNSIRFSPIGECIRVTVAIERSSIEARAQAVVQVCDEGPGVPEEIRAILFERFVQAREESQQGRGTGLGLSISRGIAELHGGTIAFENHEPQGCTFTVRLPLVHPPEADAQSSAPASQGGTHRT
jgi:signal transduction histidine kinase